MNPVIDFARALRARSSARALQTRRENAARSFRFEHVDGTGEFRLSTPQDEGFRLDERRLWRWSRLFMEAGAFLTIRRREVARARAGRCSRLRCRGRNWKRTGLCRRCLEEVLS